MKRTALLLCIFILILVSLAVSAEGANESSPSANQPEKRMLIIGINDYMTGSMEKFGRIYRFKDLKFSVKDARDVEGLFSRSSFITKVLINEEATYEAIKRGISDWLGNLDSSGTAIIYFSGHGAFVSDKNGDEEDGLDEVLVPYDYPQSEKFITDDRMKSWIEDITADTVALFLDASHSGGFDEVRGVIMASSKSDQAAKEESKFQNGIFTHFYLKAIEENIPSEEMIQYITDKMKSYGQTPVFKPPE